MNASSAPVVSPANTGPAQGRTLRAPRWKRAARKLASWGAPAAALVAVATLAALAAWGYGDLVGLLGTFAFGTFAAALAPALAVGLNWTRVTAQAAVASMATGLALNLGLELLRRYESLPWPFAPGVLPSAVALAASFAVLFGVTWWTSPDDGMLEPDVREVVEEG